MNLRSLKMAAISLIVCTSALNAHELTPTEIERLSQTYLSEVGFEIVDLERLSIEKLGNEYEVTYKLTHPLEETPYEVKLVLEHKAKVVSSSFKSIIDEQTTIPNEVLGN